MEIIEIESAGLNLYVSFDNEMPITLSLVEYNNIAIIFVKNKIKNIVVIYTFV